MAEEMTNAMVAFGMLTTNCPDKMALRGKPAQAMLQAQQRVLLKICTKVQCASSA
jgi:hypothetical protein